MTEPSEPILVDRAPPLATVVLNRQHKLNAMTLSMWRRLGETMEALDADPDLRCVVLRGAGERAFSPGNDIAEFATERGDPAQAKRYGAMMHRALAAIAGCRHPTVALIRGICVGGGLEMAACCDLRVCGASSRFGAPIKRLGLVMAYPELDALLRLVGVAATKEILLEGEVFGAERARALGLVNRVVPDAQAETEAYATARRIAEGAPLVARWHKQAIARLGDPRPLEQAERDEAYACFGTSDFQNGYRAFLEKRPPVFEGR